MFFIRTPIFLLSLALSFSGKAGEIKPIATNIKEFTGVCDKKSDYFKATGEECAVKKLRFETRDYSNYDPGDVYPYHGTVAYSGFETHTWSDITKYGFVQQIRGCTYESRKNPDGSISRRLGESIMHLDVKRTYVFPDWSIDATTTDPLYYGPLEEDSGLPGGRVALYEWTPKLGVVDKKKTRSLYQMLELPEDKRVGLSPSIMVKDVPSMAYLRGNSGTKVFNNVSLEFNICLYNLKDIPLSIDSDLPMAAQPIVCHKWNSQFEFNFKKDKFEHLPNKGLDPFCASQVPRNPSDVYAEEKNKN